MKIKQFSHTDLDGVGSAIAMKVLWGNENVDAYYCNYDSINEKIKAFVEDEAKMNEYDYIFITDISVNEEVAALLQKVNESDTGPFVQLLDHHITADWLNKYSWAHVEPNLHGQPGHKSSGTSLVIDFFERQRPGFERSISYGLRNFAEQVRRYDTWEWEDIYQDVFPKELNDYLYMTGKQAFIDLMLETIPTNSEEKTSFFDDKARTLLDFKQTEIQKYIEAKNKQLKKIHWDKDQQAGLIFAEQYVSELGNEICAMNPDITFVIIADIGHSRLSFRTKNKEINLSEIAKKYGGGGHPMAAGAPINPNAIQDFIQAAL